MLAGAWEIVRGMLGRAVACLGRLLVILNNKRIQCLVLSSSCDIAQRLAGPKRRRPVARLFLMDGAFGGSG